METNKPRGTKQAVDVSLSVSVVERARVASLNMSAMAVATFEQTFIEGERAQFEASVKRGIEDHSMYLDHYGSFADAIRKQRESETDDN